MRLPASCCCLVLFCTACAAQVSVSADPVASLHEALRAPAAGPAGRDARLRGPADALRSPDELRRALLLPEWGEADGADSLSAVDRKYHAALCERFERAARAALR